MFHEVMMQYAIFIHHGSSKGRTTDSFALTLHYQCLTDMIAPLTSKTLLPMYSCLLIQNASDSLVTYHAI